MRKMSLVFLFCFSSVLANVEDKLSLGMFDIEILKSKILEFYLMMPSGHYPFKSDDFFMAACQVSVNDYAMDKELVGDDFLKYIVRDWEGERFCRDEIFPLFNHVL